MCNKWLHFRCEGITNKIYADHYTCSLCTLKQLQDQQKTITKSMLKSSRGRRKPLLPSSPLARKATLNWAFSSMPKLHLRSISLLHEKYTVFSPFVVVFHSVEFFLVGIKVLCLLLALINVPSFSIPQHKESFYFSLCCLSLTCHAMQYYILESFPYLFIYPIPLHILFPLYMKICHAREEISPLCLHALLITEGKRLMYWSKLCIDIEYFIRRWSSLPETHVFQLQFNVTIWSVKCVTNTYLGRYIYHKYTYVHQLHAAIATLSVLIIIIISLIYNILTNIRSNLYYDSLAI